MLSQKILQLLLPEVDRYLLWSASSKESLFSFSAKKNLRRRHKNEDHISIQEQKRKYATPQ